VSIEHLSYVSCDRCGQAGPLGGDGKQARVLAERAGWEYRNWNVRMKDVCPKCVTWSPKIESVVA
jgi:Fe2+ or Zn2+ uptake regulation protein